MAAKAKAASSDVTVPRTVLKQFVSMAEGLENADNNYKSCQATLFRSYAQGLFKSANMRAAVAQAKEALGNE